MGDAKLWRVGERGARSAKVMMGGGGGEKGPVGERGERRGPEMQSTLASFTEQATLTHREGDYREGKAG